MLKNDADVSSRGGAYGRALQTTSANGEIQIVRLLLESGAGANIQADRSALYFVLRNGHAGVVRLLRVDRVDVLTSEEGEEHSS